MLALSVLDSCVILFLNNGGDKQTQYRNSIFSHWHYFLIPLLKHKNNFSKHFWIVVVFISTLSTLGNV